MFVALKLMRKVATEDCILFLNIGDNAEYPAKGWGISHYSANLAGWILIQDIIWLKSLGGKGHFQSTPGTKHLNNLYEHVFMLVLDKDKYSLDRLAIGEPYSDKSNIKRFNHTQDLRCAGNVWFIPYETTTQKNKKNHPASFPKELAKRCIKLNSCKGPVLDPFAGVCTTARACEELNVDYTMIDIIQSNIDTGKLLLDSDRKARQNAGTP